jgi:putative colanic acid biosynthesis UDP-glucose lipid carrier transferase
MDGGSDPRRWAAMEWPENARESHPVHTEMLFVSNLLVGVLLGFVSSFFYLRILHGCSGVNAAPAPLWREMMLGSVIAALVMREPGLGHDRNPTAKAQRVRTLIDRGGTVIIILLSVGLLTRALNDVAGLWLIGWAGLFAAWIGLSRMGMSRYWIGYVGHTRLRESVVLVGAPDLVRDLAAQLATAANVVVIIDDYAEPADGHGVSGEIVDLLVMARAGAIDTVILAFNPGDNVNVDALLRQLKTVPVQVAFCAKLEGLPPATRALRTLAGIALAVVADRPLQRWDLVLKAIFDRVCACVLMTLAGPLFLATAIAIACDSPGPLIFRQVRSGLCGRQFTLYKFRTMRCQTGVALHRQTMRNDPRFTRVGAFLRRNSLDELPQLWNVVCGDMSLVGPRPHAEAFHAREIAARAIVNEYAQRQRMKPGMTGWAQIHGLRGALDTEEQLRQRIEFDLYYIDHWSIWLDIKILARTPCVVLAAENAY